MGKVGKGCRLLEMNKYLKSTIVQGHFSGVYQPVMPVSKLTSASDTSKK